MPRVFLSLMLSLMALALTAAAMSAGSPIDFSFKSRGTVEAVRATLARTLRIDEASLPFSLELVDYCSGTRPSASSSELCFELNDTYTNQVRVRATSGPDLARGAATYLREACNMSFSWSRAGGNQVASAAKFVAAGLWPRVGSTAGSRWRLRDIAYGFNVVTFSYSHAWLQFASGDPAGSWEELLDWMALEGVNLALAYGGQEEVYRKVYATLGINSSAFAAWSNGPAHLAWSRGQSMHGVGGPLPLDSAKQQCAP